MGNNACSSFIDGKVPNIMLICYQAIENELYRKQDWLFKKMNEMSQQRTNAMYKAKDYLKGKELMMALASAKAALMEDQKLGALAPIKEKLTKNINDLAMVRKKEENQPMTFDKLREQISINPLEKLKELVTRWVSDFEDMLGNPSTSVNLIDEIAKDLKSNPVDLFKKLQSITELGNFDEGIIDMAFNPKVKALDMARKLLAKKDNEIDEEIKDYHSQKKKCIDLAKDKVNSKNYINALMTLKTIPLFEGKIQCGTLVKKALSSELKEIENELEQTKTSKLSLGEIKNLFNADQVSVMTGVLSKWLSNQQKIVSDLITSPEDMLASLSNPISMNPLEIVKELNNFGILPKIDVTSIMKDNTLRAAGSILDKFGL